jgi:hypothetical protein
MHKKQMKKAFVYVIVCETPGKSCEKLGKTPLGLSICGIRAYNALRTFW